MCSHVALFCQGQCADPHAGAPAHVARCSPETATETDRGPGRGALLSAAGFAAQGQLEKFGPAPPL